MFGDSKALSLELGIARRSTEAMTFERGFFPFGCPLGRTGRSRLDHSSRGTVLDAECDWTQTVPATIGSWTGPVDAAFVWFGTWDVLDRHVAAVGNRWTNIDDPAYRAWLLSEMETFTDVLIARHVPRVIWMSVPVTAKAPSGTRLAQWNELLHELAAQRPTVELLDIADWVRNPAAAQRLFPDGVHTTSGNPDPNDDTSAELAAACLVPLLQSPPPTTSTAREHQCVGTAAP
jgi:hypothetical protein